MIPRGTRDSNEPNGHLPTLIACFLHFDLSFMLWVLLGALGIFIAESVHLTPAQKGLVVAIPLLSGSLMRVLVGLFSDRFGSKRVGIAPPVIADPPKIGPLLASLADHLAKTRRQRQRARPS